MHHDKKYIVVYVTIICIIYDAHTHARARTHTHTQVCAATGRIVERHASMGKAALRAGLSSTNQVLYLL